MENRLKFVDFLKAFAIFTVVLGKRPKMTYCGD